MLSTRQLEALLKLFEERMQGVTQTYLEAMGEHLKQIGNLTPTDVHRLKEMKRVGVNAKKIQREIAKAANLSLSDLDKVFRAVAQSDAQFAKQWFASPYPALVKGAPKLSTPIERILKAQLRVTAQEFKNLSQTTILTQNYRDAVDVAIQTVQSGVTDYNSAMRATIRKAAADGLRVQYPNSGLTRRLDSAVRQNVLDGVRSLNNDIYGQLGKEYGADGVELSAHALCAEDHLPYQGRQFSNPEFERIQATLKRPIGMWNCKHTIYPIILGVSQPTHTEAELDLYRRNSTEQIEIDGRRMTRYEWSQEQRRIETAIRYQKDVAIAYKASGDMAGRRSAQATINALQERYARLSEAAGLDEQKGRMAVAGFRRVKAVGELKNPPKDDIIITDKQLGKKAGRHMKEWDLDPTSAKDRQKFIDISNNIRRNADEVRRVQWLFDKDGKRTVEVNAYIKGNDVVLVDDNHFYITTMKDGIYNNRVKGGKRVES